MKTCISILIIIFTLSLPRLIPDSKNDPIFVDERITRKYKNDFRQFKKEIDQLVFICAKALENFSMSGSLLSPSSQRESKIRHQLKKTRLAYKRIEFLFDYLKTEYNQNFVNGPPLIKLDKNYSQTGITPPNGLQTLDELIFSDYLLNEITHIHQLALELQENIERISASHLHFKLTDHSIIQAMRSGMIRVFALGLTGYDTPGSGNAIEEATISMRAMEKMFNSFSSDLEPEAENIFQEINLLFERSNKLLRSNTDFDSFDRMAFLKKIINPLYAKLLHFQQLNGIRTGPFKYNSQNYLSENLFDVDFLNLEFYGFTSFIPLNNPSTIKLGKLLFYDPILSKNMDMACASCHNPDIAFTDGLAKSKTNKANIFTKRNSPTLIDAGFASRIFWDLREYNLEQQVAHVFEDSLEFNIKFREITNRLSKSETYVKLFEDNYKHIAKKPIYKRTISNAIAAYVNSLISFNSELDQFVRNETDTYPEEALRGFNLFMGKGACGTCHFVPVFNGLVPPFYMELESEVLGITMGFDTINPQIDSDPGRANNGKKTEAFEHLQNSFKTVTIRNAALTAPYMHNGLFNTLEEVIEFYDKGGGAGLGLDINNQTLPTTPLHLLAQEKKDLISFLHTLTDTSGLTSRISQLPKFEMKPEWNKRSIKY